MLSRLYQKGGSIVFHSFVETLNLCNPKLLLSSLLRVKLKIGITLNNVSYRFNMLKKHINPPH